MRKTWDINDIRVAMLVVGVRFFSLFVEMTLVYFFIYHYAYENGLPVWAVGLISFFIAFFFLLCCASVLLGIASILVHLYYRLTKPVKTAKPA